jgi:hypothetical protein
MEDELGHPTAGQQLLRGLEMRGHFGFCIVERRRGRLGDYQRQQPYLLGCGGGLGAAGGVVRGGVERGGVGLVANPAAIGIKGTRGVASSIDSDRGLDSF